MGGKEYFFFEVNTFLVDFRSFLYYNIFIIFNQINFDILDNFIALLFLVWICIIGAFEKFIRVTMILPLTGLQYSEKVAENCVAIWKSLGIYTDAEAKAIEKFLEVFKDENFPPGSSILFTLSAQGSLTVSAKPCQMIKQSLVLLY